MQQPDDTPDKEVHASRAVNALVDIATAANIELFHTPDEVAYATIDHGDRRDTWPVQSQQFKRYIARQLYKERNAAPGATTVEMAIDQVCALAVYDHPQHDVSTRVAKVDTAIYLDLGDEYGRVVEIDASGWRKCDFPPVRYRRPNGYRALPFPLRGGSIEDLRKFVSVGSDDDFHLTVGWAVYAFCPDGVYPILVFSGEQGSAKSTASRVLRDLIDPNIAPIRSTPRGTEDLLIAAKNNQVLAFDNLSAIKGWLSDDLCRLSTGGGLSKRQLYSDDAEVVIAVRRPIIINGIEDVATRGDLLDRSLMVRKPRIREFRTERSLNAEFAEVRPYLLGVLLDGVASALARLDSVTIPNPPRMADFAAWVTAAEPAFGWSEGTILGAYQRNRGKVHEIALETSPLVAPLREVAADGRFDGTATELLERLHGLVDEDAQRQPGWPKNASKLGSALRRLAPSLRSDGIDVVFHDHDRNARKRRIEVVVIGDDGDSNDTSDTSDSTLQSVLPLGEAA